MNQFASKVNVLGTTWTIDVKKQDKDKILQSVEGYADRTTRRIEIQIDIALAIRRVQIEQLRLDDIRRVVIHLGAEENHAVHHQAAEHIHLRHVQLTLLEDSGRDIAVRRLYVICTLRQDLLHMHGVKALRSGKFQKVIFHFFSAAFSAARFACAR